jgi:phosphatidylserine/phosphatidylglycerophosphate/cardiolipin synthase-like enzyme
MSTTRLFPRSAVCVGLLAACAPTYLSPDAAERGVARSACAESAILALVNGPATTEAALVGAGVYVLGARNVLARRAGADRLLNTADDLVFGSVAEVDLVPQIGTSSMAALEAWGAEACAASVVFSPQPWADSHLAKLVTLFDGAERSIDVAIYSFSDSAVRDALARAVTRGVTVRVLYESAAANAAKPAGSWSASLEDRGMEVRGVNKIMHHKFAIVDGARTSLEQAADATVVTASGNWSNSAATKFDENTVILRGDARAALAYQAEFDAMWTHSRPFVWNETLPSVPSLPVTADDVAAAAGSDVWFTSANFRVYESSTYGWTWAKDGSQQEVVSRLVDLVHQAEHSLWIASGHFRSRPIAEAVIEQQRLHPDLDVRVYLDAQEFTSAWTFDDEEADYTDCLASAQDADDRTSCTELGNHFGTLLVREGVPVRYKTYSYRWDYSYAPQMHDKYLIVDGETVATGSYNYSFNAEYDTFENVIVLDRARYPELVDGFVANHTALWETNRAAFEPLLADVTDGAGAVPLVFPSLALTWEQVDTLKDAIRMACPEVDSEAYRDAPAAHLTCPR